MRYSSVLFVFINFNFCEMAMNKLVTSFQKFSPFIAPRLHESISTKLTPQSSFTNLVSLQCKREFHISGHKYRVLDSHRYPPWKYPSNKNKRWDPPTKYSEKYEYTVKKLPVIKTGGRGPNGRIWTHRKGGEGKRYYRMIDWVRGGPELSEKPLIEKVEKVQYDPLRSSNIALVASGERMRYIIATQNMKTGDLIKSSVKLSKEIVKANEGDSYPLGCLPLGTFVNSVQAIPGEPGKFAVAAGVSALIVRKLDDKVIVRLPSKREICVSNKCTATVGRVSNINHSKIVIGKAGRNRWRGIRPKSGRWHRKEGKHGRKIRPIKPMQIFDTPRQPKPEGKRFTFVQKPWFTHPL